MKNFVLQLESLTTSLLFLRNPDIINEVIVVIRMHISWRVGGRIIITIENDRNVVAIVVVVFLVLGMIPNYTKVPFIQNGIVSTLIPSVIFENLTAMLLDFYLFTDKFAIFIRSPLKDSGVHFRRLT